MLLSQRERLLEAMVAAVAEKGYVGATIADIIGYAGVSRSAFYEHFRDKEDCFIVAFEEGARIHFDQIVRAAAAEETPVGQLRASVHRYLEVLADQPAYARTFLVEILAAGPEAAARREAINDRYVELAIAWHRQLAADMPAPPPEPPREIFEATAGGVNDLVARWIRHGRAGELGELEDVILAFWLSAHGFSEEAAELQASGSA